MRGLILEVMSILGWLVAYFAARWFSPEVGMYLPIGTSGGSLNHLAAFICTFLAVLIIWGLLARLIRMAIHATPLNALDRTLGGLFGIARGLLILLTVATVV